MINVMASEPNDIRNPDIILIGAGIMSATLGMLIKELEPDATIDIYERLDQAAAESSDAWNNAGTGHSAFCELNYTPQLEDGSIDTSKAAKIAESFEVSKQFWAYLVQNNIISPSQDFIKHIPHISFVWGEENVDFLHKRYEALQKYHLFKGMQYAEDPNTLTKWMPLVMEGRAAGGPVAATCMELGTDVNFGALTRSMFNRLQQLPSVSLFFNADVRNLDQQDDGTWTVKIKDLETGKRSKVQTRFIFIGAGGGSLTLLEEQRQSLLDFQFQTVGQTSSHVGLAIRPPRIFGSQSGDDRCEFQSSGIGDR